MAAVGKNTLSLCRAILREIKRSELHTASSQSPTWLHIKSSLRGRRKFGDIKSVDNLLYTFLCYITSSTSHRDLLQYYGRKGERSVEESARLVGLKLPQEPSDE